MRYRTTLTIAIVGLILLSSSGPVFANGGPVSPFASRTAGSLQPVVNSEVQLIAEDLDIYLLDDFNHYRVEAEYILSNPEKARTVPFGVPIARSVRDGDGAEGLETPADKIELQLEGNRISCEPVQTLDDNGQAIPGEINLDAFQRDDSPYEPFHAGWGIYHRSWCKTELELPKSRSISLKLSYKARLFYEDTETNKTTLTSFGPRVLGYQLYPAGYWAGNARHVGITVHLGPYSNVPVKKTSPKEFEKILRKNEYKRPVEAYVVSPPGADVSDSTIEWSFENVDLKKLHSVKLYLRVQKMLSHYQLATWEHGSHYEVAPRKVGARVGHATASSTHEPASPEYNHDPENVLDRDPATAWCEGSDGDGEGEWIEISYRGADILKGGWPHAIVPGYAKSQKTYLGNGRVEKFAVEPCGGGEAVETHSVELSDHYYTSARFVSESGINPPTRTITKTAREKLSNDHYSFHRFETGDRTEVCYRLKILEVDPGKSGDTCISELVPIGNPISDLRDGDRFNIEDKIEKWKRQMSE